MKVVHAKTNRNRKIRALPVTGNYLVGTGYEWAEPNESWRLFAHTGQQRCLITNIRRDDTDHSPDLWLYTVLKGTEMTIDRSQGFPSRKPKEEIGAELMEQNRLKLDPTRRWYIRQFLETDRVGSRRFSGLPLKAFWSMWRQTIPIDAIQFYGLSNQQTKVLYDSMNFNTFMKWPEFQKDVGESDRHITRGRTRWAVSQRVVPWLEKNCQGGIIPFSDYDLMFPDDQDEFTYLTDVA